VQVIDNGNNEITVERDVGKHEKQSSLSGLQGITCPDFWCVYMANGTMDKCPDLNN